MIEARTPVQGLYLSRAKSTNMLASAILSSKAKLHEVWGAEL